MNAVLISELANTGGLQGSPAAMVLAVVALLAIPVGALALVLLAVIGATKQRRAGK